MTSTPFSSITSSLKKQITALTQTLTPHFHPEGTPGKTSPPPLPRWHSLLRLRFNSGASHFIHPATPAFLSQAPASFYALWLDSHKLFSSAYFENIDDTLEHAQHRKLDYLCRTLRLKPEERLLDIGCGWGTLICWAAQHYGVYAHGVASSLEEYEVTQKKIHELGLEDRVSVELNTASISTAKEHYDKITAGLNFPEQWNSKVLPRYLSLAHRLLKPEGLFLTQALTSYASYATSATKARPTRFINRSVFLAGQLESAGHIQNTMEHHGFEIHDVEALRTHQALTFMHWIERLEKQQEAALGHVSEEMVKEWHLYLRACAVQFESGQTGLYQMVLSKKGASLSAIPLTRKDIYLPGQDDDQEAALGGVESLPGPALTLKNF